MNAPFANRPVNPNIMPSITPRNWWVVSSQDASTAALRTDFFILPNGEAGLGVSFVVNVPPMYCLWYLRVEYPTADGLIRIGDNNPPILIPTTLAADPQRGFPFELDMSKIKCPICGPLKIYILAGTLVDGSPVAQPVTFCAIVGELP